MWELVMIERRDRGLAWVARVEYGPYATRQEASDHLLKQVALAASAHGNGTSPTYGRTVDVVTSADLYHPWGYQRWYVNRTHAIGTERENS